MTCCLVVYTIVIIKFHKSLKTTKVWDFTILSSRIISWDILYSEPWVKPILMPQVTFFVYLLTPNSKKLLKLFKASPCDTHNALYLQARHSEDQKSKGQEQSENKVINQEFEAVKNELQSLLNSRESGTLVKNASINSGRDPEMELLIKRALKIAYKAGKENLDPQYITHKISRTRSWKEEKQNWKVLFV